LSDPAFWIYDKLSYLYAIIAILGLLLVAELVKYKRKPYTHLATSYNFGTPLGDSPYMFKEEK